MNTPPIDEHSFTSGLDLNNEDREVKNGKSRYVLNGRSGTSDRDRVGGIEIMRGNKPHGELTIGETVIGSCDDNRNNAVVSFVHAASVFISYSLAGVISIGSPSYISINDSSYEILLGATLRITQGSNVFVGKVVNIPADSIFGLSTISGTLLMADIDSIEALNAHYIRRIYMQSGVIERLSNPALMGPIMNFSLARKIINPRIIESSFGQLLAWTDNNAPRLMNIALMKVGGAYYSTAADSQYINLAKQPPQEVLSCVFADDATASVNLLANRFFQFRYRYIYVDGQVSSLSPISDLVIPTDPTKLNNVIRISFGSTHQTVVKIEFIVREGDGSSKDGTVNTGWYSFSKLDTPASSPISFYGNENKVSVDSIQSEKLFEAVPILANEIEVTDSSQIVLGGLTEGYDPYDGGHSVSVAYNNKRGFIIYSYPAYHSLGLVLPISNLVLPDAGDTLFIEDHETILTAADVVSNVTLANKISALLNSYPVPVRVTNVTVVGDIANVNITSGPNIGTVVSYPYNRAIPCVKTNNYYDVGIVYYDEFLRQTSVNIIERNVYVRGPYFPNSSIGQELWGLGASFNLPSIPGIPNETMGDKPSIDVTLGTFPLWAKFYSIVLTEPYEDFRYIGVEIDTASVSGYNVEKITGSFDIEVNDFLRFPLSSTSATFATGKSYKVDKVDPVNDFFNIITGAEVIATVGEVTVEVYRRRDKSNIYHEVYFDAIPPASSIVHIDKYSAYFIYDEKFVANTDIKRYIETPSATNSDTNMYWPIKGRVQVELANSSKRIYIGTMLRWGGQIINNTQVNNLSTWDEGNYNNELNAKFGDISGLRQIGYTLKILQWINMNSAFLGRKQLQNADGSTQLVVTDSLIGTINPSEQGHGTKYPGSVVSANGILYFFDTVKGVYCADVGNGIITISDADTQRYWLNASTLVKSDSNYEVLSGFDFTYGDLYVTIKNAVTKFSETIYFNSAQKQWKSFVDMYGSDDTPIDWYGFVGQTFVAFLKGQHWEQNVLSESGVPVYGKMFGVQRKFINEFITNVEKEKVKIFLTHSIHVNTLPEIVKLRTQENDMFPTGMYSELMPGNYEYREGVFYAAIKGDAYTKGVPLTPELKRFYIARGRAMRGHALKVRIEFNTPEYVVLMSSGIGQVISDKS